MSTSTISTMMPPASASAATPPSPSTVADDDLWDHNFVNEEHVKAFERALLASDFAQVEGDVSPHSPRLSPAVTEGRVGEPSGSTPQTWQYGPDNGALRSGEGTIGHGQSNGISNQERVEKLTATSDFAPIHQRVSRRRARSSQQGWTYHLMRWPLLSFFFFIIALEFECYVLIRQIVNAFEYLIAWPGKTAGIQQEMRKAKTYDEWIHAAKKMDEYLGFDEWKETDEDSYFDHILVKRVDRTLARLRAAGDSRGLMDALSVCVRSNFAGTEGVKMYSETFYGTKNLVERHTKEVAECLDYIRVAANVSLEEKRAFFRSVNKNYGSSALCLSGGASFGYYHFGVVKAFLDADLLPRVITGTSAGGLVAALVCTRTDAELKKLLVPRIADKITACEDPISVWLKRFWKTGARFSSVEWARKAMFFTHGSLTFKEAYERTGRALNVSVVPSDRHSPTILLNHLTAPNCLIWSAIMASAAVPGILNPVVLMAKDRNGQVKPHNLGGSRFKDGSLREDIPLGSLHTQFNCNFSIVSQTNPHIHLFFFAPRGSVGRPVAHRKGKGWRGGFILSALESYIKLDLTKHFKVIRNLDLMPQLLQSDWSGVFLQRFSGDLTLTPRSTIGDWFRLLSDPNRAQLARMMDVGERVTWPALRMVHNRMLIERAILRGRTEVRQAVNRDKTTTDPDARDIIRLVEERGSTPTQVPIESDADAGFASRSKRTRAARDAHEFSSSSSSPLRRRKPFPRASYLPSSSAAATKVPQTPVKQEFAQPALERTYATSIGDTLRHVRSSSLSALSSPFRKLSYEGESSKRRSQKSITRWFGEMSASDSDDEDEEAEWFAQNGSGVDDGTASDPSAGDPTVLDPEDSDDGAQYAATLHSPPQQDTALRD